MGRNKWHHKTKSKKSGNKKKKFRLRQIFSFRSFAVFFSVFFLCLWALDFCFPLKFYAIIKEYAEEYSLEPELICSIIHAESRFDIFAVSNKGASGLMQIKKTTADWAAGEMKLENYSYEKIFEPEINIRIGCWYIRNLINQFGSYNSAICAYNAGSGNVTKWLSDDKCSADGKNLAYIPFRETRNYLRRVNFNKKIYGFLLGFYKEKSGVEAKKMSMQHS